MYNKKGKAAGRLAKINKYWVWVRPAEQQLLQRDFTSPHSPETALKDDWWYKMATKKKKASNIHVKATYGDTLYSGSELYVLSTLETYT